MKRLNNIMMSMDPNTRTYTEMYNGRMLVYDPGCPGMPPYPDELPVYYQGNIGYEIRGTHKLAQDRPTITILIPQELLWQVPEQPDHSEGELRMKRLEYFLKHMDESTETYKEMYKGEMIMHFPPSPTGECMEPEKQYHASYWYREMEAEITVDHKLAQDRPVITWYIPAVRLLPEAFCREYFDGEAGESLSGEEFESFAKEMHRAYAEAAADFCLREFRRCVDGLNRELYNRSRPDKENGKYEISCPGGEVLARNGAYFALRSQKDYRNGSGINVYLLNDGVSRPVQMCLCLKMQVQLPQKKLRKATQMLCKDLPKAVDSFVEEFDREGLMRTLELAEKQVCIRSWLKHSDYCAFVANGSILPREKGSALPLKGAVAFQSVPEDEIEICGIRGMGIRKGVTVITGGGYSGKSTLLDAVSAGIYNHVKGDGRELCITDETAVTISAEDGRNVKSVNISPFIKWLPGGSTEDFSTEHASGSTSQAANIMEALDGGAGLLLIDEDRSATNFMIRDGMMKELIRREPITPFTDRVRELSGNQGVSTILVIGGSGEYLGVADKVYRMEEYRIADVTEEARQIYNQRNAGRKAGEEDADADVSRADWKQHRLLYSDGFTSYPQGSGSEKLQVSDMGFILIGDEKIDVRGLHDIVSSAQLDTLGFMLRYLEIKNTDGQVALGKMVDELYERIEREGLDFLYSSYFTTCRRFLDLPRKQELLALINRMRGIRFAAENFQRL